MKILIPRSPFNIKAKGIGLLASLEHYWSCATNGEAVQQTNTRRCTNVVSILGQH